MKLRIHKNSIRLRLSQIEVDEIAKGNSIYEVLEIGESMANHFHYSLSPIKALDFITADYNKDKLVISIPKSHAEEWANTDLVSLTNDPQHRLTILIEKDFQCLHKRPDEDESQNFPNPMA